MTTLLRPARSVPAEDIAWAYDACREIARARARNFYYGLKLTPEPKRSAVYSIYAWMRRGDDEADAATDVASRRASLARFRDATERILAGEGLPAPQARDPVWCAFANTLNTYEVSPDDIRAMMHGLEEDLDHDGYDTDEQLNEYCARVASTVGRVCVAIWGLRPGADRAEAMRLANLRGLAFQLTNILRDFGEDFDQGRVYLPKGAFARHGLTPEQLRRWSRPACEAFVVERAALTRRLYTESQDLERMIEPSCAPTLWAMTRIYSGLLEKIERGPARVAGERRIRLQSLHKAGIAIRAVMLSRRDEW